MKRIHSWMRFAFGVFFWLNASGLYRPALTPAVQALAERLGIEFASVSIIFALLAFSLLSLYGFKNGLLSVVYIYTFPFIFVWKVGRYIGYIVKWMHKGVKSAIPSSTEGVPFSELMPLVKILSSRKVAEIQPIIPAIGGDSPAPAKEPHEERMAPFSLALKISGVAMGRSTLLCGFLIVASSIKGLVVLGLILTSLGVLRANILFLRNAFGIKKVTAFVNANFVKWVDASAELARSQLNSGANKDNPVKGLISWKFMLSLVAKVREVPELLTVGGIFAFVAIYIWIASVFYFIYLGIAKLTLVKTQWPQWSDSFLFPMLAGNIARTPILTAVVALQWVEIALLVYVLWNFLGCEVDIFRKSILKFDAVIDERITSLEAEIAKRDAPISEPPSPVASSIRVKQQKSRKSKADDPRLGLSS